MVETKTAARQTDAGRTQPTPGKHSRRKTPGAADRRHRMRNDYRQTVIDEICRQIDARLRGDVHEFSITITDDGRYRLGGWCARYHVKQMAQHLAMNLVSEGNLINEIQVRTVR